MPTDITSASRRAEPSQDSPRRTRDAEAKSGFLAMVGSGTRRDVRVVVYRTSSEHFAVVYPRKRLGKPVAVLSLKNATAKRTDVGFDVRQKDYDDTAFVKFACKERDVESWVSAFTARAPLAQPGASLPVLLEAEEVYDE